MRQSEIEVESEEWDKPWSIRDFEIGGKIGRGQYGKVYSVRERRTGLGLIFALKVMKLDKITEDSSEQNIMREINIHQQLYHENVIKFHGYFFDEKNISFILEYAECCLFSKMFNEKNEHVLKEPDAAKYAYQVIKALEYIHSKGVVHRDIKPENILIGVDGQIKITDFGWAKRITDETQDIVELNASVAGTLAYLCPEMFEADIKYDGYKVDNWCVGILVYEMVFGKTPFEEKDRKRNRFDYPTGKRVNRQCKELISGLLKVDPDDRAELIDALKNKWLSKPTNC